MKLRILMLLLAVLAPWVARAQLTYAYDSYVVGKTTNYIATVTNYTGGGAVTIPSGFFHGLYFYRVVAIGDNAFGTTDWLEPNTTLTSVTIPDSVTSIGNGAFQLCIGLTNVTLGNGVTSIGDFAFYSSGLTSIIFPDSVRSIGDYAFAGTALTKVTVGNGVTSIGDYAFSEGPTLTNLTLGNGVTSIGQGAFYANSGLTSIIIPDSVTRLGTNALYLCSGLTNVTLSHNLTSIEAGVFERCGSLKSVVIPAGVTNIGDAVFRSDTNLTSVTLSTNLTSIGIQTFAGDVSLTSLTIPASVKTLGVQAFYNDVSLTNVTFLGDAPSLLGDGTLGGAYTTIYYLLGMSGWGSTYGGLTAVPLSTNGLILTLTNGAFTVTGCTGGGNVTIPAVFYGYPVTAIAAGAFANNNALTGIVIPNSVTNIGIQAFQNDIYLTSVTLSTNLTSIGIQTFAGDVSLTSLTIPASVKTLGVQAFYNNVSLTNVTFLGDAPSLGNATFGGDYATIYYYYGTHGWTNPFGGLTAVMLGAPSPPQIGGDAGVNSGNFGFTLTGVASQTIVVEASTNLTSWLPVWTNTLTGTTMNFTDPQWKNFPARFYRAR